MRTSQKKESWCSRKTGKVGSCIWYGSAVASVSYCESQTFVESLELEGTFKGHLVQLPCNEQGHHSHIRLPRASSSLALKVSRDGASTTSLGNLCQCITTLTVKDFFFTSNLNLPSLIQSL